MSRPHFIVKVPSIPIRPRSRKKLKKKTAANNSSAKLETIQEARNVDRMSSSYYSLNSQSSGSGLKVLETYDEFLNLKDLDNVLIKLPNSGFKSEESYQSKSKSDMDESIFLLKQICADLKNPLEILHQRNGLQVTSLFQAKTAKMKEYDIKTAIIAQRIIDTQDQVEKSKGNSRAGFSKESFKQPSFSKRRSITSLSNIKQLHCSSAFFKESLTKTLSNLTHKHVPKLDKVQTCEYEVQVNIRDSKVCPVQHSCNTQTDRHGAANSSLMAVKVFQSKIIQTLKKSKSKYVQSSIIACQDKFVNTDSSFCPNQERCTQMYEHITENDLFCMEWINNNLFRVPVNPFTVIVDEKVKDSSEYTCNGTSFFEKELTWERQALCL